MTNANVTDMKLFDRGKKSEIESFMGHKIKYSIIWPTFSKEPVIRVM